MRYALRLHGLTHPVPQGRLLVGRAETCELSLDDPLVSRAHAALVAHADRLVVEDLGSRNGVRVNGEKIAQPRDLAVGDVLRIGSANIIVVEDDRLTHEDPSTSSGAKTVNRSTTTQRFGAFGTLASLADKALALGHGDDAERILSKPLEALVADTRPTDAPKDAAFAAQEPPTILRDIDEQTFKRAAEYGMRLAAATGRGRWLDYVFRLHATYDRLMEASLVDELYGVVRRVQGASPAQLEAYLERIRASVASRGPSERFLMGRLEGLLALLR